MSLRYIKTSAPSYVTGAAMTTPEQFTDNINFYSDGYNPYQIVLQTDEAPPVEVGLVPMDEIQQKQQPAMEPSDDVGIGEEDENAVVIEEDDDDVEEVQVPVTEEAEADLEGHGYPLRSSSLPNAVTIIPVGAGLAADKGLVSEDLPIIHDGTLPEAEIDNALDASVPALVPVEDVVMSNDGRLALNKRGGMIRAYGYRTGDGDIIYGDGLVIFLRK